MFIHFRSVKNRKICHDLIAESMDVFPEVVYECLLQFVRELVMIDQCRYDLWEILWLYVLLT